MTATTTPPCRGTRRQPRAPGTNTEAAASRGSSRAAGRSASPSSRSWPRSSPTTRWAQFCQRTRNWSPPSWPKRWRSTSPRGRLARRSVRPRRRAMSYPKTTWTAKRRS
uniref:Uncharacterized protein n=1 Tax=Arundo donax TaxID=35708 RepID=A0A0A9G808_ARUDO